MKALLMLALVMSFAFADLCSEGSELVKGNWYCQAVKRITYKDVGGAGTYDRITSMDATTGKCGSVKQKYSGPLAPLDEDVSCHDSAGNLIS
jgi:hypothetical protein